MSINIRKRLAVLGTAGLCGLAAFGIAVGGASAAQAAPARTLTQVSFVVPSPVKYQPITLVTMEVDSTDMSSDTFDGSIFCSDGNSYSVPVSVAHDYAWHARVWYYLPASESGATCNLTIGVTGPPATSIQFANPVLSSVPGASQIYIRGTMPTVVGTGRGQQY